LNCVLAYAGADNLPAICELFTLTGHYANVKLDQRQLYQQEELKDIIGIRV
jgi:hypothetical protein